MKSKRSTWVLMLLFGLLIMSPVHTALGASLQLGVTSAPVGGTAVAVISLQDTTDVESFALTLRFSSGAILTLSTPDFFTRGDYYPESLFGSVPQVDKNHTKEAVSGTKVYLNSFSPNGLSGAIGTVTFDVSSTAEVGDTQVLALSGQYRSSATGAFELLADVTATFIVSDSVVTYDVTPSVDGGNGTISPNSIQTVDGGDIVEFTLTPAGGYQVNNVGGTCGGSLNGNVFTTTAVTSDCSVIANFHIPTYSVTPSVDGGNGTISPDTIQVVTIDETVQFTLSPASGYNINAVGGTCGGNLNGDIFTTSNITSNCTVIASFSTPTHSVTPIVDGGNGTISPDTVQTVNNGETAQFNLIPATDYEVNTVGGTCGGNLSGNVFTTNNVLFNCTVIANFRPEDSTLYTVIPSVNGEGGTINPDSEQSVIEGTEVQFILTSDSGYHVRRSPGGSCPTGVLINIDDGVYGYTTGAIVEDCTVQAIFEKGNLFNWNIFLPAIMSGSKEE